jgi:hypothetical protein
MGSPLHVQVKARIYDMVELIAPRGLPLKQYLGLEGSLLGCKGGSIHGGAFPVLNKVNLKASQAKGESH